MALFKISKGLKENLPSAKTDGHVYFCIDDGSFWIDYKDESSVVQRKQINAANSDTLGGASLSTTLTYSESEVPTSSAVSNALSQKSEVKLVTWTSADMI